MSHLKVGFMLLQRLSIIQATTIGAIVLFHPAATQAQGITPYGPAVDRPQNVAYQAEERGDFDTAIVNYRRALTAASSLTDPILRPCGMAGAESRLRGAEAAKSYIQQYGRSPDQIAAARAASQTAFRQYWDAFGQARPDLVNSCP